MFDCYYRVFSDYTVQKVVEDLIEKSQWFVVMPLPDGDFQVGVKVENRHVLDATY